MPSTSLSAHHDRQLPSQLCSLWPAQQQRRRHVFTWRARSAAVAPVDSSHQQAINFLHTQLLSSNTAYTFVGATAARLQGVAVPHQPHCAADVQVCVQWDALESLHDTLTQEHQLQPGPIQQHGRGQLGFSFQLQDMQVLVQASLNTVLRMDPQRVSVVDPVSQQQLLCESLLSVRQKAPPDLAAAIDAHLHELQQQLTAANAKAWSQAEAEAAWVNKVGAPEETAHKIIAEPWLRLGPPLFKHLPEDLSGLRFINLMGSHGTKAVAAAVLGAKATCVDISPVNAAYCAEVAAAAGVNVEFVVADVLNLPPDLNGTHDIVLLECGVLHYFLDIVPLFRVVRALLRPGGRLVLREFHPVSTKLITSKGRKHIATGNYFSQQLVESNVAYTKYTAVQQGKQEQEASRVQLRQWGLGEVVTAACAAGLVVQCLEEEPGVKADDAGLPKLFTVVASRA